MRGSIDRSSLASAGGERQQAVASLAESAAGKRQGSAGGSWHRGGIDRAGGAEPELDRAAGDDRDRLAGRRRLTGDGQELDLRARMGIRELNRQLLDPVGNLDPDP